MLARFNGSGFTLARNLTDEQTTTALQSIREIESRAPECTVNDYKTLKFELRNLQSTARAPTQYTRRVSQAKHTVAVTNSAKLDRMDDEAGDEVVAPGSDVEDSETVDLGADLDDAAPRPEHRLGHIRGLIRRDVTALQLDAASLHSHLVAERHIVKSLEGTAADDELTELPEHITRFVVKQAAVDQDLVGARDANARDVRAFSGETRLTRSAALPAKASAAGEDEEDPIVVDEGEEDEGAPADNQQGDSDAEGEAVEVEEADAAE